MSEAHPERSEQKLRYFKEPECRNPIFTLRFEEPIVVGEIGTKIVYIKNITNEELTNLVFESDDPNVKFELSNTKLMPQESTSLKIIVTPKELKPIIIKPNVKGTATAKGWTN